MESTLTIYLIRHGETLAQVSGLFSGRSDLPLTEYGKQQAFALSSRYDLSGVRTCISSPLSRCRETAEAVFKDRHIYFDDDLVEIDFGLWEMKNWQEISSIWPIEADEWARQQNDFHFPEGELTNAFLERVRLAARNIQKLAQADEKGKIAVFAHGGVIKTLICIWLKLPFKMSSHFAVDIASVSCMSLTGDFGYLSFLNEKSHLNLIEKPSESSVFKKGEGQNG